MRKASSRKLNKMKILAILSIAFATALFLNANISYPMSDSNAKPVAIGFLEQVAGINMNAYTVVSVDASTDKMLDSQHFRTNVGIVINDSQNQFYALVTFIDDKFWMYTLDLVTGNLGTGEQSFNDSLTAISRARNAYRTYFNISYGSEFAQAIWTAQQTQNHTVENEQGLLTIQYAENSSTPIRYTKVRWVQRIGDQLINTRSTEIYFSNSGLLTELGDNLAIHYVASTSINTSRDEAMEIAMPYIEEYAQEHQQQVKAVNATLEYVLDLSCNRGDSFAIYPEWSVEAVFDKTNEQTVYGYSVGIWADTGAAYYHEPQGSYSLSGGSNPPSML